MPRIITDAQMDRFEKATRVLSRMRWDAILKRWDITPQAIRGCGVSPGEMGLTETAGRNPFIKGLCSDAEALRIYQAYPRRTGKVAAVRAIKAACRILALRGHADPVAFLEERTRCYAGSPAGSTPTGTDYRPYPTKWFNSEQYLAADADWLRSERASSAEHRRRIYEAADSHGDDA